MLGQTPREPQMGEGQWRLPWSPLIPHPGLAEGCELEVGQGAEKSLGEEQWKAALFYLLLPQISGTHFQGDLLLLFLKKDLIVEHPLPSGLELSLGPVGKYQVLRSWAVEEAQH